MPPPDPFQAFRFFSPEYRAVFGICRLAEFRVRLRQIGWRLFLIVALMTWFPYWLSPVFPSSALYSSIPRSRHQGTLAVGSCGARYDPTWSSCPKSQLPAAADCRRRGGQSVTYSRRSHQPWSCWSSRRVLPPFSGRSFSPLLVIDKS